MSTEKYSEKHSEKYPWAQWQLTAFVLDELEPEIAAQIQSAANIDPSLAAEITAIRATVEQVTQLYVNETAGIDPTTFAPASAANGEIVSLSAPANDSVVVAKTKAAKMNWTAVAGLLAMAASLLIAVVLAAPALRNYFRQSDDAIAIAEHTKSLATAESQSRELALSREKARAPLGTASASGSSEPMAQSTPVADVGLLEAPQDRPDSAGRYAESNVTEAAGPSVDQSNEGLKRQSQEPTELLGKDESLIGDVQIETVDEIDLDIVRGSKRDVDRTLAQLEKMKESASESDALSSGNQPTAPMLNYAQDAAPESLPADSAGVATTPQGFIAEGSPAFANETGSEIEAAELSQPGVPGVSRLAINGGGMGGVGGLEGMGGRGGFSPRGMGISEHDYEVEKEKKEDFYDSSVARGRKYGFGTEAGSDRYAPIYENPFKFVESDPLTTFSIDVDTASYVKARQFLLQSHALPPANAVRVEEFINYFEYEYAGPQGDDPFAANLAVANCPWRADHKLVRIALQAKKMDVSERPKANIVFLLDVSGSMDEPNKLPLVKESMRMMIQQLGENDRVAMVVYAGAAGCVLESTTGNNQEMILGALDRLNAGGSTNGGQGIQLAYDIARDHYIPGGVNRVILCTDGDFNVGTTSTEGLVNLVVENAKSKVFLTVLGYGMGNTNDAMMEQISNKGNGVYGFVDSRREAQRQMIKQLAGNLMTVAKDVKIQVEFNPERVASYRLIGYENRKLANEDFANDKKDAGEIGAGHRVTALYEIEPIGAAKVQPVEGLRYQKRKPEVAAEQTVKPNDETSNELLTVSLRYKQPEGDISKLLTFPLVDGNKPFAEVDQDFKWAASVAQFAMLLRNSTHKGSASWSGLLESSESLATDESRRECLNMIRAAASMSAGR